MNEKSKTLKNLCGLSFLAFANVLHYNSIMEVSGPSLFIESTDSVLLELILLPTQ